MSASNPDTHDSDCDGSSEAPCRRSWLPAAALLHWNGTKQAVVIVALHHGEATVVDAEGDLVVYPIHRLQLAEPIDLSECVA